VKDERWAVLLFREIGSAKVRSFGELDYWLGECDRSSRARLLYRLHLVGTVPHVNDLIISDA
jgi:hypothetical protein